MSRPLTQSVGTLNPRPPGLPNQLAQFVKKALRRSLPWYTRLLHLFHGSVTRALNQIMLALDSIHTISPNFNSGGSVWITDYAPFESGQVGTLGTAMSLLASWMSCVSIVEK